LRITEDPKGEASPVLYVNVIEINSEGWISR
jgi:hypothetical protein